VEKKPRQSRARFCYVHNILLLIEKKKVEAIKQRGSQNQTEKLVALVLAKRGNASAAGKGGGKRGDQGSKKKF